MKKLILILSMLNMPVYGQEQIRQDNVVIGKPSTATDKSLKFDTNDGASNPSLSVEKTSKKLKYSQNQFQLGSSSTTDSKEFIFNGDGKSLLYEGTANELQYNGDFFSLGDGTNTEKTLKFDKGASSPQIKWNPTTSKLQFSNNAVDFKDIGAGGGSASTGVNILDNDSFEDPVTTGWTNSGGTFSQQVYTNASDNDTKYARFVASGAGQYFESTLRTIPTNFNGGCQADFKKGNVSANGLFKIEVLDSSANVLSTQNINQLTWSKVPSISFVCPAAGSTAKLRVTSLAAGTIEVDRAYLGSNQNLVYTSQARLLGTLTYPTTANCIWSRTATTYGGFNADTDCATPIVTGELQAPSTKIPGFVLPKYLKGDYKIEATGAFAQGSTNATLAYRFFDGVNFNKGSNTVSSEVSGVQIGTGTVQGVLSNGADQSNVTIQIQAAASSGTVLIENGDRLRELSFSVWYYPSASEVAVSPEQASWFIDASIGGANTTAGVASAYTEITNAAYDLVLNPGSASANIACASGTASSGLTCTAANESIGLSFLNKETGIIEACASFTHEEAGATASTFQLIETTDTSSAIVSEGKTRIGSSSLAGGTSSSSTVCGYFNFSTIGLRTIRLAYEATGNTIIYADRNASIGQRDIHWTVRPFLSAYNRPILTGDQVTSPSAINPQLFTFKRSINGTVTDDFSDLVNGDCTNASPSVCTFNLNKVSGEPTCTMSVVGNTDQFCDFSAKSSASLSIDCRNNVSASTTTSVKTDIFCFGLKP